MFNAFLFERHEALGKGGGGKVAWSTNLLFFSKQTFLKVKFEWIAPNLCWAVLKIILKKLLRTLPAPLSRIYLFVIFWLVNIRNSFYTHPTRYNIHVDVPVWY